MSWRARRILWSLATRRWSTFAVEAASTATRGVRSRYLVAREASERGIILLQPQEISLLKKNVRESVALAAAAQPN